MESALRDWATNWTNWQSAMGSTARLELWGHRCWLGPLLELLKAFPQISTLLLGDMAMIKSLHSWPGPQRRYDREVVKGLPLLLWTAVEIRRLLPHTIVKFHNMKIQDDVGGVGVVKPESEAPPSGALRFVQHEALPPGAEVSDKRFESLSKDYVGFLPLWRAEQELLAESEAQTKRFGRLVDEAMASRF